MSPGAGGIPSSYNVNISTGDSSTTKTLRALSNGTATYNFTYSGSGVPSVSATAINCAGSATSNGTDMFPPCKRVLVNLTHAPFYMRHLLI